MVRGDGRRIVGAKTIRLLAGAVLILGTSWYWNSIFFSISALSSSASPDSRTIEIMNESGKRVDLYWISLGSDDLVLQSDKPIINGASFVLNSFVTHAFEVRELPGKRTGECGDAGSSDRTCQIGYFVVNENDDQVVYIRPGLEIEHTDNKKKARESANEMLTKCQEQAVNSLQQISSISFDQASDTIADLVSCVEFGVANELETFNEEIGFQSRIRTGMADLLENYTCADRELNTSTPLRTETWQNNGVKREVKIMHERPSSKIHLIENIISAKECEAMEEMAKPLLHRATVADGGGGTELSKSRKAMQAGIKVPWHLETEGHPVATVSRKVYDYVNHVLGLDIKENGQEDLMSIQYFGRGEGDKTPDQYTPHCDGDCNGLEFKSGNRMATMVMYCTIPELGGATNFANAGIHVVPEKGSGAFFSYINPETKIMDTGFTQHSGCPVIEGSKIIVTQWIRLGVDDENPWDSFNSLGIKITEGDDDM